MALSAKWRGILYVVSAILSVALGVAIALGFVTVGQIDEWVAAGVYAVTTVASVLARLNLTSDPQ